MTKTHIAITSSKAPLDFVSALGALILAYTVRSQTDLIPFVQLETTYIPPFEEFFWFALAAAVAYTCILALEGLYNMNRNRSFRREFLGVTYGTLLWIMLIIAYFFIIREFFFSRLVLMYSAVFTLTFALTHRLLLKGIRRQLLKIGIGKSKVAVIGDSDLMKKLLPSLQNSTGSDVVAVFYTKHKPLFKADSYRIDEHMFDHLTALHPDEVIHLQDSTNSNKTSELLSFCRINHVRYRMIPNVLELQLTNVDIEWQEGLPIIELKPSRLDGWGRVLKRIFDIVGALSAFIVLSPFIIGTAIAVAIQMKSLKQVVFQHKRYGYRGQLFQFYKFQSMVVGAAKLHEKMMNEGQTERKGLLKLKKDPRVTTVGRFIRKTSLDELPQLWNVLKGDMSLVGPRPHMPSEIDRVTKEYQRVLSIKPGITGLAQVNGRSSNNFDDEMKLDLAYIQEWSLWMDLVILWKTVVKVLGNKDAS